MSRPKRETKQTLLFSFDQSHKITTEKEKGEHTDEEDDANSLSSDEPTIQLTKPNKKVIDSGGRSSAGSIFGQIHKTKNIASEVDHWVVCYKGNKVAAMVDLVNFILMAAGSGKAWIARDVDLEALGPSEIDTLLHDMMAEMSQSDAKAYPLREKANKSGCFRDKYQQFFDLLAEKLRLLPADAPKKSLHPTEVLQTVLEQLVTLSSMALMPVRDAVTEAALCMGASLLKSCIELKEQGAVAHRQIVAMETGASNKSSLRSNPKYISCVKVRDSAAHELEGLCALANLVFNSVLVHRLKDFHESVRAVAVRHLHAFLLFDAASPIKVECLKYVGFSCSDHADPVRLEAVRIVAALLKDEVRAPLLQQFVEHFMDRFVQIASLDKDPAVALAMVQAFRSMQKCGLLDSVPEERLDVVDGIVFDTQAGERVRTEALLFLMDHTEGFEDVVGPAIQANDEEDERSVRSKGKKKTTSGDIVADAGKALAKRQRTAMQLETLTEFAEHHLEERFELSTRLATACLLIPNYEVLYDWSTIIALLLRESEELISCSLRTSQAAILLHMFVASAQDVHRKRLQGVDSGGNWEALNANLQRSLPSLLQRFRDDEANLGALAGLLELCDFSYATSTGSNGAGGAINISNQKNLKGLLRIVADLFATAQSEPVLAKMASALHTWRSGAHGSSNTATLSSAISDIVIAAWEAVGDALRRLQDVQPLSIGKSKVKGKKALNTMSLANWTSLASTLDRFRLLLDRIDVCAASKDVMPEDVMEVLVAVSRLAAHCDPDVEASCVRAARSAAWAMNSLVLWQYKAVVDFGKSAQAAAAASKKRKASGRRGGAAKKSKGKKASQGSSDNTTHSDEEDEDEDVDSEQVDQARAVDYECSEQDADRLALLVMQMDGLRSSMVNVLVEWMRFGDDPASQSDSVSLQSGATQSNSVKRQLPLIAFRLVSELRSYFPTRHQGYETTEGLSFAPSQDVLGLLRVVFEREGALVKAELTAAGEASDGDDETAAGSELVRVSKALVLHLLYPLSRNLVLDVDHLNRRQAAAVLSYLLDPSETVQEGVRSVMRRLKESDPVKYLEIQIVALRNAYLDQVVRLIRVRLAAETSEKEDEDFDVMQNAQLEEQACAQVEALARKLAQSMGVGKVRDQQLAALESFMRAGVDFCLADSSHVGFATLLMNYVRFLPAESMRVVAEYLSEQLAARPELAAELSAEGGADEDGFLSRDAAKLSDLQAQLLGGTKARMTSRRRAILQSPSVASNMSPAPQYAAAQRARTARQPRRLSPVVEPVRRAAARGVGSARPRYVEEEGEEDDGEAMEVSEEEEEKKLAPQKSPQRSSAPAVAMGLDIEDDDDEEGEEEDFLRVQNKGRGRVRTGAAHRKSVVVHRRSQQPSQRSGSQRMSSASQRDIVVAQSDDEEVEEDEDDEDDGSVLADLDSLPSTRRFR